MILRCVCWNVFLCLALGTAAKAQVEVNENGYQNVLISFTPNVPSDNGHEFVQSLKDLLEEASGVLQTAIGIRIASATFLLPPSWPTEKFENITIGAASSAQTERRPDFSVDATEQSPFGKQPFTLQHGGCGVHGHQITLPLDFLSSSEEYPKGKLLAREWLKYRYGVFDENGFKNDKLYPDFYRIPGSSEITITQCTDWNVTYEFKKPGDGEACDMESADFDQCTTHPDAESAGNVTSSLMYFHKGLHHMEHICGTDDHPHQSTVRSKQNALCNGQSILDVIKLSEDYKTLQPPPAEPVSEPIQFSFVQESQPRFVVLLENSDNLYERIAPIGFALRRFYYDLPPKSKLAIYTYTSGVAGALSYTELPAPEERSDLGAIADFTYSQGDICTSCGLAEATQILLPNSEVEKGSILLVTASSLDNVPAFDEKLKDSGICLHVLKFQGAADPVDESYEPLRGLFNDCFTFQSTVSEDLESFNSLYNFLKSPVPESNDDFEIKTVVSENMSGKDLVTIPQDATAALYTLWLARNFASSGSVQCKAGEDDVTLTSGTKGTAISAFTFDPVNSDVTCRLSSAKQEAILSQVQMTTQKGNYFVFDTWIHDASTDTEQLPIKIYAKIYFGGYPVKDASVTTVVTSADNPEVTVTMLDNGRGDPDITQNDGIYSGYFSEFLSEGEYHITVKMDDNGALAKIGKENTAQMSSPCCGSEVISGEEAVPAFEMEKQVVYNAKNKRPDDGYPPSRIVDLQVGTFNVSHYLTLTWTAPGGGKAERYALKLFHNRENAVKNFDTTGQEINVSSITPGEYGKTEEFTLQLDDLERDTTYHATMRSWNEFNKTSGISNVAEFTLPRDGGEPTGIDPTPTPKGIKDEEDSKKRAETRKRTIEIVVGVLAGIVVLCILVYLAIYFFVQKPKRKEDKLKARKKAENGGGQRPTTGSGGQRTSSGPAGQIGLNSIPADVIIKHHNEVQEAKSLHKDPPIFKEESLDSFKSSPDLPENARRNERVAAAQYTMVQKVPEGTASSSSQQDPSKSPKRMTVV